MLQKIGTFISNNQRFIPLSATMAMFFIAYTLGATYYEGMRDPQVFFNLFRTYPFLLISAIGMTFVILTGGIDLSVSGVVALTTITAAALLRSGWNAWIVILFCLMLGMALGAMMGFFITYLKVQPFIATLAGMWFTRGLCFFISDDAIAIDNRVFRILGHTKILIPGLSDPAAKTGDFISILVVVALLLLLVAIYVAHFTRFGRTVYAMGGNEQSARLMGLPVNSTKVLVYTFSGFCSALAGITLSIYVMSGHGLYAQSFELDVIASVVMGGTLLSGGSGYVFGTLFGVLINVVIQTIIQFNGQLSSWWTRIVIGALTLIFIGAQSLLAARKGRRLAAESEKKKAILTFSSFIRRRWRLLLAGGGVLLVIILVPVAIRYMQYASAPKMDATTQQAGCQDRPFRQEQATNLLKEEGAVIIYERNGGPNCIDELYVIYSNGRITGDNGLTKQEKQITPADVDKLLSAINDLGWFTNEMYNTWHSRCGHCYGYYITVSHQGRVKTVKGVDGGTDAPTKYWDAASLIIGAIPRLPSSAP